LQLLIREAFDQLAFLLVVGLRNLRDPLATRRMQIRRDLRQDFSSVVKLEHHVKRVHHCERPHLLLFGLA
jgi:hypothetical protein